MPPENGEGAPPPQAPPLVNDAATTPHVPNQCPTDDRQERARLAAADEQYVSRSYLRAVDPVIKRYRRLLREAASSSTRRVRTTIHRPQLASGRTGRPTS